ncbi:MAG: hypothetical protein ACT4P1_02780 [Sporichthyaceae bacterium]
MDPDNTGQPWTFSSYPRLREAERFQRRLDLLTLPVVALDHHGFLAPPHQPDFDRHAVAIGIGPENTAAAVWRVSNDPRQLHVALYRQSEFLTSFPIATDLDVTHVQPMPGHQVVVASARTDGRPNAQVWSPDGTLTCAGHLGDAIRHLLVDATGAVWAGYRDEGVLSGGPGSEGVARFSADLQLDWQFKEPSTGYAMLDCYVMNIDEAGAAHCCTYGAFPIFTVNGDGVTWRGQSPVAGPSAIALAGSSGAFVGGYAQDYDLVTPVTFGPEGAVPGPPRRVVMPDGMEVPRRGWVCRGSELHLVDPLVGAWLRVGLNMLCSEATTLPRPKGFVPK